MDEEKKLEQVLTREREEQTELERARSQDRNDGTELAQREEPVMIEPLHQVGTKKELGKSGFGKSEKHTFQQGTNESSPSRSDSSDEAKTETKATAPWYSRINPLTSGTIPPVPKQRAVSREQRANFLSLLTFQWINPLMT